MTVKEGRELVKQLRVEIDNGIDVEFNKQWIEVLNKSILKGIEKGYTKALSRI